MPWRDSEGRISGGTYASWIDRQIAAAEQRGEFDNLPGTGKPLTNLGSADDPDWWVKQVIAREQLDMSVALPPQLALRKEAHELPDRVLEERSEQAVRDLVDDFNVRVRDCWLQPREGPAVVVRTIDPDELVAHWRAHHKRHGGARASERLRDHREADPMPANACSAQSDPCPSDPSEDLRSRRFLGWLFRRRS